MNKEIIVTTGKVAVISQVDAERLLDDILSELICGHEMKYQMFMERNGMCPDQEKDEVGYDKWMTKMTKRMHAPREAFQKRIIGAIFNLHNHGT